ncbi:MAG: flagellar hook assembly protein FlgD [Pseudomonadota bacterium]
MTAIDTIRQFQDLGLSSPPVEPTSQSVGQTEFLELMLAQFENQDPFEPMENGEFLTQLAQFSTATGIEELQASFADFASSLNSDQALQAASLVGNEVLVNSELVNLSISGNPVNGVVPLERASGNVTLDILDSAGQLVRSMELGVQPIGQTEFRWDGRLENGDVAPSGVYTLSARVARGGEVENVPTLVRTAVDSVLLGQNGGGVYINSQELGEFAFDRVRQIF